MMSYTGVPKSMDGYDKISKLGSGSFATVYKCRVKSGAKNSEPVALKVINISNIKDSNGVKCAKKEFSTSSFFLHPNIIRTFDFFEVKNPMRHELVIVMEYMSGGSLEDFIQDNLLTKYHIPCEKSTWRIFVQVASAIEYMHERRAIHRDLKPANVMLTSNLTVKVGDFGLSRIASYRTVEVKTVCGTPYYMSPERIHQTGYTYASDIWSLGCMLYEMVVGVNPFFGERDNRYSLGNKVGSAEFPPVAEDHYSIQLVNLIYACLQVDASDRPNASFVHSYSAIMNNIFLKRC